MPVKFTENAVILAKKVAVIDTIKAKEKTIRESLGNLRNKLNGKRTDFNNNPNDWSYLTALSFTEDKLKEILDYIESSPQ